MTKQIKIQGIFGTLSGTVCPDEILVSFKNDAGHESISIVSTQNDMQIILPFDKIETLIKRVQLKAKNLNNDFIEEEIEIEGLYSSKKIFLNNGLILVALRANKTMSMLSVAYENKGQISFPYNPVETLISQVRK